MPAKLKRYIEEPSWREAWPQMPQTGNDDPGDGERELLRRQIEYYELEPLLFQQFRP